MVDDGPAGMERVLAASTLPALLLGGEVPDDPKATFTQWGKLLEQPTVQGLVVGRALLYPADGDVDGAIAQGGEPTLTSRLHWPAGTASRGPYAVEVTADNAGWGYTSLRVVELQPDGSLHFDTGPEEIVVLPLAGGCVVTCDGETFELEGRPDVFSRVSDCAYAPRDAAVRRPVRLVVAVSRLSGHGASAGSSRATARPRMSLSRSVARVPAADRSTTSAQPTPSTPTD